MNPTELAQANLKALAANRYPGRIIFVGRSPEGNLIMGAGITVRSPKYQNRRYEQDGRGRVYTEAADPSQMKQEDMANIIYDAMDEAGRHFMVSNGKQTSLVHSISRDLASSLLLAGYGYEDDPPATPRITARSGSGVDGNFFTEMTILKKSPFDESVIANSFRFDRIPPGFAYYLSTYEENGAPPPSFRGEPRLLPLVAGGREAIASAIWDVLDHEFRVALVVKEVDSTGQSSTFIINRFEKVPA